MLAVPQAQLRRNREIGEPGLLFLRLDGCLVYLGLTDAGESSRGTAQPPKEEAGHVPRVVRRALPFGLAQQ